MRALVRQQIREEVRNAQQEQELLQEWLIGWTKKKIQSIKDFAKFRISLLEKGQTKYVVFMDSKRTVVGKLDRNRNYSEETFPLGEFNSKINELRERGYNVVKEAGKLYVFLKYIIDTIGRRIITSAIFAGLILLAIALIKFYPAISIYHIGGVAVGAYLATFASILNPLAPIATSFVALAVGNQSIGFVKSLDLKSQAASTINKTKELVEK